MSILKC